MEKLIIVSDYAVNQTTGSHYVIAFDDDPRRSVTAGQVEVQGRLVSTFYAYADAERFVKAEMGILNEEYAV